MTLYHSTPLIAVGNAFHWHLQISALVVYGLEFQSIAINLISIVVYTGHFWPELRAELRTEAVENLKDERK